jgi:hypothetical protein
MSLALKEHLSGSKRLNIHSGGSKQPGKTTPDGFVVVHNTDE